MTRRQIRKKADGHAGVGRFLDDVCELRGSKRAVGYDEFLDEDPSRSATFDDALQIIDAADDLASVNADSLVGFVVVQYRDHRNGSVV